MLKMRTEIKKMNINYFMYDIFNDILNYIYNTKKKWKKWQGIEKITI